MAATYFVATLVISSSLSLVSSASFRVSDLDFRKTFTPPDILLVSSATQKKVSYTSMANFKSQDGKVRAVIDAGLVAPYGIAWDAPRSALYVCDASLKKIFRVKLKVEKCQGKSCKDAEYSLREDGSRFTVAENVVSHWLSVDTAGNLFFTDQDANTVNKLDVHVIDLIVKERLTAKELKQTSEPEAEGEEAAKEGMEKDDHARTILRKAKILKESTIPHTILHLYEANASKNVGTPSGISASGPHLYWANMAGGTSAGSVAYGQTNPSVKKPAEGDDKPSFPSAMLANNTPSAYGVALTSNMAVYTDAQNYLWGASRGTGKAVALTKDLVKPRGIIWDNDNLVYVADEGGNRVVSVNVGLLKPGAHVGHVLDINAPFGIALVKSSDPIWSRMETHHSGAQSATIFSVIALLMLSLPM